ncbi:hypothetical protein A2W67_01930 [Candidatus Nomurabacteria bacterium RIFCSPLOWO2_02_40_28]|uniref:Uncharacterized protein n=2 Tax=Candidatus Nomuraibacteriota TaxID=1752729 RepID=A0A837I152_9BACT|nr:MAG: hypothetical protein UT27_C0005G0038 [Candidatus Nomurabacteria bacterium GW2011_GWD2_39_12]KKR20304.1 MAG: hypothetical protein UT51_C0005G0037 [Candidatus Nomurabacteria bacterium GW2011_GWC2_39_41]KKR36259.1 MAG: hypothetical protein UT70_C0019G0009 [Candidatus Nomurabacteria bacterium GW2011_GWE2_40_10]KKR38397.1 MAG: hypothetical protein UT73_C0003G0037 [Candidatus Nomurabacteria bacterium GW2011_GWB1_40_11]KKR39896.1 MAG: hypothetical protein UT74_C0005G0113 [Parcubacteria group b
MLFNGGNLLGLTKSVVDFVGRHPSGTCEVKSGLFMLSQKALEEFKTIWSEEFGEEISDEFAMKQAVNLLVLFNATYKPIKNEWLKQYDDEKSKKTTI